jgi:hypothetical protein
MRQQIFAIQNYTILTPKALMVALRNSKYLQYKNYTILTLKALMVALRNSKHLQYKTTLS